MRGVELGRYLLAVYIASCGIAMGSLHDLSRHFSAELESSFECNRSEIHMEGHQRTHCNTDNNSVDAQVCHSFFYLEIPEKESIKIYQIRLFVACLVSFV